MNRDALVTEHGADRISIWKKQTDLPAFPSLPGDMERDAVVIGGGMCGILTGYYLKKAGVRTVVLEADTIGSGQTAGTTAKITSQHGCIYDRLIRDVGRERARQYAQGNQQAVVEFARLIRERDIDCDFHKCAAYIYSMKDRERMEREAHAAALCGIHAGFTEQTELPFSVKGAVRFGGQARFSPLKFLGSLATELEIYEHTRVTGVEPQEVRTNWGRVRAGHIIFACHYPFVNVPGFYFMRMYQDRSYVLALSGTMLRETDGITECAGPATGTGGKVAGELFLPEHMYLGVDDDWDLSFRRAGDLLLFGGESHRTGAYNSIVSRYEKLVLKAKRWWPEAEVCAHWSAQDCMTLDGIPYIGTFSGLRDRWYVATGFQKWGMTSSMVSAMVISGMIAGKIPEWAGVFSPRRFTPKASAAGLVSQTEHSVVNLSRSFLMPPKDVLDGLKPGEGKIVEWKGKKAGVYMDEGGGIYPVSPRCPHLGCQLSFNPAEKTWDCPCHGSRFSYKGELISNPAQTGISREENHL